MSFVPTSMLLSAFGKRRAPEPHTSVIALVLKSILKHVPASLSQSLSSKRVRFADSQLTLLPCVPVKSSGFFQGLTASVTSSHMCRAFFESGAAINIVKTHAFNNVSRSSARHIPCSPPDLTVSGISGNILLPPDCLSVTLRTLNHYLFLYFYVIDDVCFNADMLLGYHTMSHFSISPFPSTHQIARNGTFLSASHPPGSHYLPPVTSVMPLPHTAPVLITQISSESSSVTHDPSLTSSSTPADSPSDALFNDINIPSHDTLTFSRSQ
ncbi:hypothetical protein E2C01_048662 [Portunus trituberculatus]|uniref:Uncharacterized protein n=1 Tax=Portunus trituberculatus TaxID=210409 RepID=A0A5B7GBK3_PORTR|nr:hypothetical protein [Portunus trituberculatus]